MSVIAFPLLLIVATGASPADGSPPYIVSVDWDGTPTRTVLTAASFEVDIMPHLSRVPEGGSFNGYYEALSSLGSAYVRFSPWFGYPRLAVTELTPPDCSVTGTGSSWNSSELDIVTRDFMAAVCGPRAAHGECDGGRSVAAQISTMPAWMYVDGDNRTAEIPDDPWQYPSGKFTYYVVEDKPLKDPSCEEMARYAARYVGWYTKGGFVDECGRQHVSGLHYPWWGLSVLNEDEYGTPPENGVQYTRCYDAWKREIRKINPEIHLLGPEIAGFPKRGNPPSPAGAAPATTAATSASASSRIAFGTAPAQPPHQQSNQQSHPARPSRQATPAPLGSQLQWSLYFLNGSNHDDGVPPPYISNHVAMHGPPFSQFFDGVDDWCATVADPIEAARRSLAPEAVQVMNEFIPFMEEWCDHERSPSCGSYQMKSTRGAKMNRTTLGWNAAAASFAYGYGRLAERGFLYLGNDQLIGGCWPDNEPAVAALDWETGEPNAKYMVVRLLATELGAGQKHLYRTTSALPPHEAPSGHAKHENGVSKRSLYALGMLVDAWQGRHARRVILLVSKLGVDQIARIGSARSAMATVLEAAGPEPGFAPPVSRQVSADGLLRLGPYAVALVFLE